MSSVYFITPYDPKAWEDPDDQTEKPTSDLKIYSKYFRTALFDHWGANRLKEDGNTSILNNVWFLKNPRDINDGDLRIDLQNNHQVISIDTWPNYLILEFVLWYRQFIPAIYPLYFFHSSSWDRLLLTTDITEQELIYFMGKRKG